MTAPLPQERTQPAGKTHYKVQVSEAPVDAAPWFQS
jgi:hypothetical protein